ncbi:MAG: hypothetical protein GY722_02900 [bacterium]|nr:hypothetical protein [bacterium]
MSKVDPGAWNPSRLHVSQRPAGAIFRQTWDTLAHQPASVVAAEAWGARLLGRPFTSQEWTDYPDDIKNSISNLGLLRMARDVTVPCLYEYVTPGQQHDDGVDNTPPYSTDDAHHPKNGWQLYTQALAYGATNNKFIEDDTPAGNDTRLYEDSDTAFSTFDRSGSGQANGLTSRMWTWFESVTGI